MIDYMCLKVRDYMYIFITWVRLRITLMGLNYSNTLIVLGREGIMSTITCIMVMDRYSLSNIS
jgi:hypothetical protein